MIESSKNNIWGRIYQIGKNASGRYQSICSCGGRYAKQATIHLSDFDYQPIKIDRAEFAKLILQHRKNEKSKAKEK